MMKKIKLIILMFVTMLTAALCSIFLINRATHQSDWKSKTTPLPAETRALLCNSFQLSPNDTLCSGREDVYGPDFVSVIQDTFKPYQTYGEDKSESATYSEVKEKLRSFEYECEPVTHQADGFSYFVCYYDLRGDRAFIIAMAFSYPDTVLTRITSTSKFGD